MLGPSAPRGKQKKLAPDHLGVMGGAFRANPIPRPPPQVTAPTQATKVSRAGNWLDFARAAPSLT